MKHGILFIALLCTTAAFGSVKGHVIKCISGDCQNGNGEAILSRNSNDVGEIRYTGAFRNGMMDGEGTAIYTGNTTDHIHTGTFSENEPSGNGADWQIRQAGGQAVPDSSKEVVFGKWDEDGVYKGLLVDEEGSTRVSARGQKYLNTKKVKDKWINEQAEGFVAARKGKFAAQAKPTEEERELATRVADVARDRWSACIEWDCLADRRYFIVTESKAKYHAMPFGGHVTIQVVAADNTVAWEGPADMYWTPRTAGRYTFQLKFYQDKIIGDQSLHSNYVDGMRLQWWLKSLRKL